MWIFLGVLVAFLCWFIFKLSIVSLYVLLFSGTIVGAVVMAVVYRNKGRHRENH